MKKALMVITILLIVATLYATFVFYRHKIAKPDISTYMGTQYSDYYGSGYRCSKPIKLKEEKAYITHRAGTTYETISVPFDPLEAKEVCYITSSE